MPIYVYTPPAKPRSKAEIAAEMFMSLGMREPADTVLGILLQVEQLQAMRKAMTDLVEQETAERGQ